MLLAHILEPAFHCLANCVIASQLLPLTSLSAQAPKLVLETSDLVFDTFLDEQGRQLNVHYMRIELYSHRYAKATCGLQSYLLAPLRPLGRPRLLV